MKEYLFMGYDGMFICVVTAYNANDAISYVKNHNIDYDYIIELDEITHYSAYDVN